MFSSRDADVLSQHTYQRRSFSHNIRTSFDSASSRLSFSGKSDKPARRSISGPRSVSSLGIRYDQKMLEQDVPVFDGYTINASSDSLGGSNVAEKQYISPLEHSTTAQSLHHGGCDPTPDQYTRPASILSSRENSLSSINSTGTKWYKRLHRAGSANRLSKAIDTAEAATNQAPTKMYNPFSRRRSVPALARKSSQTILGQSATSAIEIGGHSANACRILFPDLPSSQSIEIPYIVDACVMWLIENHADLTPGIFRINGSSQAVRTIMEHFSAGCLRMPLEDITLPAKQLISVHDVASVLKKFLVLLPGGLFGDHVFDKLNTIVSETDEASPQITGKNIADVLQTISELPRYNTILILLAFLHRIAEQAPSPASNKPLKQESGQMTSFSLGIVFSPTCLGSREGSADMVRSSTSHSEQSVQSESTPIEEAVAVARAGAKVMQILIALWPEISVHLPTLSLDQSTADDVVSLLDVVSLRSENSHNEPRSQLHTILDSPVKARQQSGHTHDRSESVDTVTMTRKDNSNESAIMLRDAQIDLLKARVRQAELEKDDAITNLRLQEAENAKLYTRNLLLERENKSLRTKK